MISGEIQALYDAIGSLIEDGGKHDKGNDAAGRRLRKGLMEAVNTCRDLRKKIQDERNARKG